MNYYQTLGLEPGSSQEDIKKAYRRLASKHHPDRGGDAEEFKKIQEAYERLSNPEKYQPEFSPNGFQDFSSVFDFVNPAEDFFRGFGQGSQYQRNPDAVVNVTISLEQAYKGTDFFLDVGFAKEMLQLQPGIRHGTKLRLPGRGHSRFKNAAPGDLVVKILVSDLADIKRNEDDLIQDVTVDSITAITGGEITVNHISGKGLKIKIPAGSQQDSKLRITGWGMPNPATGKKGNLYVVTKLKTPTITDTQHLAALNKIKEEIFNEQTFHN
jgi:DnaJ-class molecular chaperone